MPNTNMTELPSLYQQYIHKSRYARWLPELNRRETWDETVQRYTLFFSDYLSENHSIGNQDVKVLKTIEKAILNLEVMPSMRALMSAGPALERDHIAGFNCSFINIDDQRAFDEILYVLMCGTGVGFSVERQHVNSLPAVPEKLEDVNVTIVVGDSKMGWADSLRELIGYLYDGRIPKWDVSLLRGPGERLKVFGGRASGPKPLIELFQFAVHTFKKAAGRKLNSLEAHDLVCKIGEIVVVGGVRRSALISLSNLSDQRMRDAKSGNWWENNVQRALANNSTAYTEKPEVGQWMKEWTSIYDSKSGERGIFNREAAVKQSQRFGRLTEINGEPIQFGTNPCGEIILRSQQFCNLTEVVARAEDTKETIRKKVILATILGTFQSCLTNYRYIRDKWTENSREERLLGVSFTGIMDSPVLNGSLGREERNEFLAELRQLSEDTNTKWADKLGIQKSAAICCVKPSGTVSQLVDASSGIHSRHSSHYIRTVRNDIKDPLTQYLIDSGVPHEPDVTKPEEIMVFSFPISAPEGAVCRDDRSALEELETWLDFKEHWCHHNPSVTVTVREEEWPGVGAWVWDNFDKVAGISFLPHSDHVYQQAPYQEVDRDTVKDLQKIMPIAIDWMSLFEDDDDTTGAQELACVSGSCEI